MIIVIKGKIRSTQLIYKVTCNGRHPRMYMTKEGKKIKKNYKEQIRKQYDGEPMEGDVRLGVRFFFPTRHKRDIDNYSKILLDALEGIAYKDDQQIKEMWIKKDYDKDDPRIDVEIKRTI